MMGEIQAVILAAGMGTRLKGLTEDTPKTLIDLDGRPILDYILASLDLPEIGEIIVVGGFAFDRLKDHLSRYRARPLRLLRNERFRDGSVFTVERAFEALDRDFLLVNGDHIHPREMIRRFMDAARGVACACDFDRPLGDDDMKIKLSGARCVEGMDKKLPAWDCGYIGMTFCRHDCLAEYREAAARAREIHGDGANAERIVLTLAGGPRPPMVVDLSGFGWIEVDTPEDLEAARRSIRENPHLRALT